MGSTTLLSSQSNPVKPADSISADLGGSFYGGELRGGQKRGGGDAGFTGGGLQGDGDPLCLRQLAARRRQGAAIWLTTTDGAASALRRHVQEQARDLSGEAFSRLMDQTHDRITNLLESNEVAGNLGALRAIDELIDIRIGENAVKVAKIAKYKTTAFEVKPRAGGAMTADEVEHLVKTALEWLRGDRVEYRLFAAVNSKREMAENASTVFNVHVPEFVDAIWVALRDQKLEVRQRAVEALRACLRIIEKRETRWRVQCNAPIHSIHGSLLAVGELLSSRSYLHEIIPLRGNTGEFMMSRYREVAEIILTYLENRDRLVRLSITSLLPRIDHFLRDRFVTNSLTVCMNHILHALTIPAEAACGFPAGALDGELINYLPTITSHLRDAIASRRGRPSMEALACVGNIAKAMGPSVESHVRSLLDAMFFTGLSPTLVEALENITTTFHLCSQVPTIQKRLLECISGVLSRNQQFQSRPANAITRTSSSAATLQVSELTGSALVQLALQTLARFNYKAQFSSSRTSRVGGKRRRLVEEIVEKLLTAAVADADVTV
ncbi:hypothetical protein CASFOL_042371 [Castilleja foliolosa]|uniref:Serine/threonine-protein kinase TOR n=1 Tax=Castilleja foliolosa TaxID=1961234 RepID=A0ABD3BBP5_9LAMI